MRGGGRDLVRIRENQRRSRERRKEYTQHLEQRLRSFESLGVAASQEIQEAGKRVARENAFLRSLVMLYGVTDKQVKEYLESRTDTIPESSARLPEQSGNLPSSSHISQIPLPGLDARLDTRGAGYSPLKSAAQDENPVVFLLTVPVQLELVPNTTAWWQHGHWSVHMLRECSRDYREPEGVFKYPRCAIGTWT